MSHNILITGGTGYLGGSLLADLTTANLPPYAHLFALVRNPSQATAMETHYPNVIPLTIDLTSPASITTTIVSHNITIIYHLIDARDTNTPTYFIRGLAAVQKSTGIQTHFLFTTGAKLFSSHAGAPSTDPLPDSSPDMYDLQKRLTTSAPLELARQGTLANTLVVDEASQLGVRAYIFAPCIVYGAGRGAFGNRISIQTVAVVKAAKALGKVVDVNVPGTESSWPVCHIDDNTALYVAILRAALEGRDDVPFGKDGWYLASSGSVAWKQFYEGVAKPMKKMGVVESEQVERWDGDEEALRGMWGAWGHPGEPTLELVRMVIGGECSMTAENGRKIGWKPQYAPEHILETVDEEVSWILENLES
ncbi:unnamed protein product [Periconia digitata]|uniref:NAD-dependent epimerase/dehydratase domain-containing protein n=1 Tax=Periconia digitata TaxID=1303443 RepID=A0A9W4U9X8_9PLEO|nr:unnamed protein product [Periconia digitata]